MRQGLVTVTDEADRSVVRLRGDAFFASGSAEPMAASMPVLVRIGQALAEVKGDVLITGHSDNQPIRSLRYPSNWHLSTARADAVKTALTSLVDPARMKVILLGVDDGFVPPTQPRVPGRIMAMASADAPMKGIATLLESFAKLRTERDVELILVTKPQAGGRTERLIDKLAIGDSVRFAHGLSEAELVSLMGSAEVACVPSLYEGFSLPTAELMACATPLVVSRAGAIPAAPWTPRLRMSTAC